MFLQQALGMLGIRPDMSEIGKNRSESDAGKDDT